MLKRKIVRAGRRFGKTVAASIIAVNEFLNARRILYAVPTAEQMARFWHEIVTDLAEPLEYGVFKKYEADKIIELPGTEQRIKAKTAWNADTLRGDYADVLILDEFQLMNEETWTQVGAPMLIDNNGDAVFIYTPPSLRSRSASKAEDPLHAAKLFKRVRTDPRWLAIHGTSYENPNLSAEGLAEVSLDMSELSKRQEIMAEDIEEVPGALWNRVVLERTRVTTHPPLKRIVIGLDPTGSTENEAGIIACGRGIDDHGYVLKDATVPQASPKTWATAAIWTYYELKADRIVGERNYGGDMVEATIRNVDEKVSYADVVSTRGKLVRAEPIYALQEKGMIHHVGNFPELEDEQCSYVPGATDSPNRMDAEVFAMTLLFPDNERLGLLEMERKRKEAETGDKVQKVVTVNQTTKCPECESTAIVRRGNGWRCNQCGVEWGGQKPASNAIKRGEFIK